MCLPQSVSDPCLALWAKTSRDPNAPHGWHPLVAHLLDTLAVAQTWVSHRAPLAVVRDGARSMGWDQDTFRVALPVLVALHDLGKATGAFQAKWERAWPRLVQAHLAGDPKFPAVPLALPGHGPLGVLMIAAGVERRLSWSRPVALTVARCLGSHHGIPVRETTDDMKAGIDWGVTQLTEPIWARARKSLVDTVFHLGIPQGFAVGEPSPSPVGHLQLLGATTVLDWIASQEDVFRLAHPTIDCWEEFDPVDYFTKTACPAASVALDRAGLGARRPVPPPRGFKVLFPDLTPRPVQGIADRFLSSADGQFLLIIEDEMGGGKTEAAFQAIATARRLGATGTYLALPTRATSEQAFSRLRSFLEGPLAVSGEQLHLLHATAWMNQEYQDLRVADGRDELDGRAGLAAGEWFTRSKRGLLGEHAVGTIDQVMLGVLTVRHHWVRLWGLAGKVVVLDEIHAYDAFMTTIIERLLEWLAAAGCSVVLLSATLPNTKRAAMEKAFAGGAEWNDTGPAVSGYPRVTFRTQSGVSSLNPPAASTRLLRIDWCESDPQLIATRAVGASFHGGCVAVICNTVRRAREIFELVAGLLPGQADDDSPSAYLFTSRFRFVERAKIEQLVLRRYGKPSNVVRRPSRSVLVATQVVEQSLDIDFDLIITEFAPTDLLLQRAGRLHRHPRSRTATLALPTLLVTRPECGADGQPAFDAGSIRVYEEHVMVRSLAAVGGLPRDVALPSGIDSLVQATYDDSAVPPENLRPSWERTRHTFMTNQLTEQSNASAQLIPGPGDGPHSSTNLLWNPDDEPVNVTTRLGVSGVQLVVLFPDEKHLLEAHRTAQPGAKPGARRKLLRRSLSVPPWANPTGLETPKSWRDDPALRRAWLVETDAEGRFTDTNGVAWEYDKRRGWAMR